MRCVAITCARNEADIIEPFIRHTLAYCDTAIVLDHGSTDATPEILRQIQGEGLALHVVRDATLGRIQVDLANRLLRMAAHDFAADWILCLDADEFISGCADNSFLPVPVDENTPCLKLGARTYYCQEDDPAHVLNPVERITRCLALEPEAGDGSPHKVFVPGPLAKRPGARLVAGNHLLRIDGVQAPSRILQDVRLAHFSLRSPGQYAVKVASKRLQAHRFISPLADEGAHYEEAYVRISKSYSSFAQNFFQERLSYLPPHDTHAVVAAPLQYRGGPLRYTGAVSDTDNFTRQILGLAEALALSGGNGHAGPAEAAHPPLKIEVFSGGHGAMRECDGGRQLLEFPLTLHPDADSFRLRIVCEPGMLEISRFALVHPAAPGVERDFEVDELRKNLRVVSDAAVLHSGHVFRLLISREPAVLVFQNWKQTGQPLPVALRMETRFDDRLEKSILLHPAALNAMNRHAAAIEISEKKLRLMEDRLSHAPGGVIDFSDCGDAILFMREGWAHPEPWGVWTEGGEAVLKIRLHEIPKRAVTINASIKALVARGCDPVNAEVHVNGEKLAGWSLASGDFKPFRLKIPPEKIQSPECVIAFKILNPRSPEQLGLSGDKRLLGLGFGRMSLDW